MTRTIFITGLLAVTSVATLNYAVAQDMTTKCTKEYDGCGKNCNKGKSFEQTACLADCESSLATCLKAGIASIDAMAKEIKEKMDASKK